MGVRKNGHISIISKNKTIKTKKLHGQKAYRRGEWINEGRGVRRDEDKKIKKKRVEERTEIEERRE